MKTVEKYLIEAKDFPVFKKEIIYTINYQDFERFIANSYNIKKGFKILKLRNNSFHKYHVTGKHFNKKTVETAIKNGSLEYYALCDLLDDLAEKGIIKKGNYIIRVSW